MEDPFFVVKGSELFRSSDHVNRSHANELTVSVLVTDRELATNVQWM